MLKLQEGERVIIAFHRHWVVVANKLTFAALLLIPAAAALAILPAVAMDSGLRTLTLYFITVYIFIVLMIAFVLWMDYYLDVWIVTNTRVIDVEQKGMFRREVSEFMLSRIQDITVEIPSFVATLLHYGNLRVQTAGEKGFTAYDIPHVDKVKDIILAEVRKASSISNTPSQFQ